VNCTSAPENSIVPSAGVSLSPVASAHDVPGDMCRGPAGDVREGGKAVRLTKRGRACSLREMRSEATTREEAQAGVREPGERSRDHEHEERHGKWGARRFAGVGCIVWSATSEGARDPHWHGISFS
jgi:hypothetical protein